VWLWTSEWNLINADDFGNHVGRRVRIFPCFLCLLLEISDLSIINWCISSRTWIFHLIESRRHTRSPDNLIKVMACLHRENDEQCNKLCEEQECSKCRPLTCTYFQRKVTKCLGKPWNMECLSHDKMTRIIHSDFRLCFSHEVFSVVRVIYVVCVFIFSGRTSRLIFSGGWCRTILTTMWCTAWILQTLTTRWETHWIIQSDLLYVCSHLRHIIQDKTHRR
jgi:hypothetical protein